MVAEKKELQKATLLVNLLENMTEHQSVASSYLLN